MPKSKSHSSRPLRKHPRATTKNRPDGHAEKRFPTGISSTILAIQNYWPSLTMDKPEHLTPEQFCEQGKFIDAYERVIKLYPGIKKKAAARGGVTRMIHRLCNGKQDIEFYQMRAFAEYVGLPTGIFLLFSHFVSEEHHAIQDGVSSRDRLLTFVRRLKRVIETAESQIQTSVDTEHVFNHIYDEPSGPMDKHMAKALALKAWSDAYNL